MGGSQHRNTLDDAVGLPVSQVSLRDLSAALYGRSGSLSVARDVFGFWRAGVPRSYSRLEPSKPLRVSVREFVAALRGLCLDVNLVMIGVDQFADADDEGVDYVLLRAREIYGRVGICIRSVAWFGVPTSEAAGLDRPTELGQYHEMTDRWSGPDLAVDVFIPFHARIAGARGTDVGGQSPQPGGCDKSSKKMNGAVVSLGSAEGMAITLPHELGHYLGLGHVSDQEWQNVMCPTALAFSDTAIFYAEQASWMKIHCMIRAGLDP
jgi:hypothetical protein